MFKRKAEKLSDLFCQSIMEMEGALKEKLKFEKKANEFNMEAGLPLEDFLRDELRKVIAPPVEITCGTIIDKDSYTCGDCDIIFRDQRYVPLLRNPTAPDSRRKFIPFDTTYGILEVKQKLTLGATVLDGKLVGSEDEAIKKSSLYAACRKLFAYKELSRRDVVTQKSLDGPFVPPGSTCYQTPFGVAFFYDSDFAMDSDDKKKLADEFWGIQTLVDRPYRVNGVFVLDKVSLLWVGKNGGTESIVFRPEESDVKKISVCNRGNLTLYTMIIFILSLLYASSVPLPNYLIDYDGEKLLNMEGVDFGY